MGIDIFAAYVQRFDIIPQPNTSSRSQGARSSQADPTTHLYALKRALRSDGTRVGDVVPLAQLRSAAQLVPHFGAAADSRLTMQTSLEHSTEFWLNSYETKEMFWAMFPSL